VGKLLHAAREIQQVAIPDLIGRALDPEFARLFGIGLAIFCDIIIVIGGRRPVEASLEIAMADASGLLPAWSFFGPKVT
jgi:hypothetical protein